MQELQPELQQTSAANPVMETTGESAPTVEERMEVEERAVGVKQERPPPILHHPGPSFFLVTPVYLMKMAIKSSKNMDSGVFCVLFAILSTEKSGMPNAQIAIGLTEKNSRSREKAI
jgi:hypothetical protein